ncbi:MAG: Gfo/Idh/MocA family oxidoreductase [Bacteroidales bacterium]|nr:Gfo/Idh/MocA family oxidoreductase [Bacteroidales bacterium]
MTDMTEKNKNTSGSKMNRRDVIKGLATVPVLGAMAYGTWRKTRQDHIRNHKLAKELNMSAEEQEYTAYKHDGDTIRIGIIGFGIRGAQLMKAAGFVPPKTIQEWKDDAAKDSRNKRYSDFLEQDDLNIRVTGVCDLFDVHAGDAMAAASNIGREGMNGQMGPAAKRYKTYQDMLADDDIDAIIIATPDHWHAQMTIDAAKAGKHVYAEKGFTLTMAETYAVRDVVKFSGIVYQLGHQGRQTESYIKAKEAMDKKLIGKINLIEVCTNRNSPNGAWVYDIHPDANLKTVDWAQFEEPCEVKHPWSPERFFRWRCWWDYGTGLSGDLLTHEFDAINQILGMGIPSSVSASGGVYFYKDKQKGHYINEIREVPDVWNAVLEYPDLDFSLLYSASLASNHNRGKTIMGHDGSMELGNTLTIYADRESTRYMEQIKSGLIDPELPIYTYIPGRKNVDSVATATEQYFAARGLLYTYRGGRRVDTTHLHIAEWIQSIRESTQPSCNIDQAFEEGVAAAMGIMAQRENRTIFWDKDKELVI